MSRQLLCSVGFVLLTCLGFDPAYASTVIVPEAFPTVQSAIDSGADTVLIREGTYPERPVVDRAMVLEGIVASQRPRLDGLSIYNTNFWADPPLLSVTRIDFTGPLVHTTVSVHPRNLQFSFTECALDSGFEQVLSIDPDDVASLRFHNCRMRDSNARAYEVVMDADTVDGGVAWRVREPWIRDCWFRGGAGVAVALTDEPHSGFATRNRIEGYNIAIAVDYGGPYGIESNSIARCNTGIQLRHGMYAVTVMDNVIRDCGVGIDIQLGDAPVVVGNTIVDASSVGIAVRSGVVVEGNVVRGCGGDGVVLDDVDYGSAVRNNTIVGNGGSGIVVATATVYPIVIEGNIASSNVGWGLSVASGQACELRCNDWFSDGLGPVDGVAPDSTDLSLDPLFCSADSGDVRLKVESPLANAGTCGRIGALGVGCGVTSTLVRRFAAARVSEGIRIVWQLAVGGTESEVWLERSELEGQAWARPLTERSVEDGAVVELDRSVNSDRSYWYRLVTLEGDSVRSISSAILVGGEERPDFRLMAVGPNPSGVPVTIGFALRHAAVVELDVFDVQGRRVASLVRGTWPAGMHTVEWSGSARNGKAAPPGLYLIRYVYPGGQDRRRIMRLP